MLLLLFFFFFNDTATTEIYTLSLHDALPICLGEATPQLIEEQPHQRARPCDVRRRGREMETNGPVGRQEISERSEEHTSELQSPCNLVCRLLLEKKKNKVM